jgi:diguanylate cyclase (GGDEF)-like protein
MYFGLAALAISLIGGKRYGQIYSVLVICLVLSMHHFINLGYTNLEIFTFTVAFIGISLLSTSFIGAFDKEALELKKLNIKLYDLSIKDQLTGVFNRKGFDQTIEDKVELFKNTSEQFGLIIADIDNFKSINDNYGHSVGDDILIEFTKLLELNIGENDTLCRWGGEEFAIISAQNNLNTTVELAEKIRLAVSQADMPKVKHITASFGVATIDKNDDKFSIVKKADEALYKAKTSGKNKVVK